MKIIAGLQWYTHKEVFGKYHKDPAYMRGLNAERARLKLAAQIREIRRKKRLTQKALAEKADMPQSVIARIESGTHSFSITTLQKIAVAFNKQIALV